MADEFLDRLAEDSKRPGFSLVAACGGGRLLGFAYGYTMPAGEWWATGDGVATGAAHEDAEFLRAHVLELPIHQDLTASHVEFIATEVLRLSQRTGASSWTGVESFAATATRVSSALSPDGSDR